MGAPGAGGGGNSCSAAGCCFDMSMKCWCRWRWEHHHQGHRSASALPSALVFVLTCLVVYGLVGVACSWFMFHGGGRMLSSPGCREDNEGSWAIGVFYGESPFSLEPIETINVWKNEVAAWPVANPIFTCDSVSRASFPSNFVADPFMFIEGGDIFLFYETKNSITMQGDIGVAKSLDKGATWEQLGIALDEDWHLSYPFIFRYLGQIYMMPESHEKGELRVYRAFNFPLQWTMERIIIKKPLVDSVLINHDGGYYLLGSDHSGVTTKNGQLEIWHSKSPLGPYKAHRKNPIYDVHKSSGARNGGRPFSYNGSLYRIGQDCGKTYGHGLRIFKVESLTVDDYKEMEVPSCLKMPIGGRHAWNSARYHHLDVQQLSSGEWIGVMDGDRVPSGHLVKRFLLGYAFFAAAGPIALILGLTLYPVKFVIPHPKKRNNNLLHWEGARWIYSRLNLRITSLQWRIKLSSWPGRLFLSAIFITGAVLVCSGVKCIHGRNGGDVAYPLNGYYSQFTLVTMTYEARLWNLKMYVKHYSRCSSVKEIIVIWNKGMPPDVRELDSAVPVRIRVEEENSLNNRFKIDSWIKTRAVLELDDDIIMRCSDIERGFYVWRQNPDRIVGFYPRLIGGNPLTYRGEKFARSHNGYNMILTGAAFLDGRVAFERYWGDEARAGRELVQRHFNCEDVLLNYLYANATSSRTVEYVRPTWAIDTSKFSGEAISKNTQLHYAIRTNCLLKFTEMYGSLSGRKWEFDSRKDGWDL